VTDRLLKPHTHLCLVSAQPVPNLTPLLDQRTAPRRVILMVSPAMAQRADWLESVIRPRGIRVERLSVEDPYDVESLQSRVMELLEGLGLERGAIALNATGGTKPMSIAAYEAFRAWDQPIFYVHPERDRLIWMYPDHLPPVDLADRVKLEPFLAAHGVEIRGEASRSVSPKDHLAVGAELVKEIRRYRRAIATLNWLAKTAENDELRSEPVPDDRSDLEPLIELFAGHGLLTHREGALVFTDEDARFFANGGWLEYYAFETVRGLGRTRMIQDQAHNLEVMRQIGAKRVCNELDVVFLHENRLHIIECKTRRFREKGEASPAGDALYRLDTLKELMGGLQARAMLVSYQDLSKADRTRAQDLGIAVCAGEQLLNLRDHLLRFMR